MYYTYIVRDDVHLPQSVMEPLNRFMALTVVVFSVKRVAVFTQSWSLTVKGVL